MMLIPPPQFRKRRPRAKAPRPPIVAPLSITNVEFIDFDGTTLTLVAVFNTTEDAGLADASGADAAKWNARYLDDRFEGATVGVVDFNRLSITLTKTVADAGANELNYTNSPSDIGDVNGRMLGACSVPIE